VIPINGRREALGLTPYLTFNRRLLAKHPSFGDIECLGVTMEDKLISKTTASPPNSPVSLCLLSGVMIDSSVGVLSGDNEACLHNIAQFTRAFTRLEFLATLFQVSCAPAKS